MKKILLFTALLFAFVTSASAKVNKPVLFGIQLSDGIEFAAGDNAPDLDEEAGYRSFVALTFNTMFAFSSHFALHPAVGFNIRMFSYEDDNYWSNSDIDDNSDIAMAVYIPVMGRAYINEICYIELGATFDINIFEEYYSGYTEEWHSIDSEKPLNIGIGGGIGGTFWFGLEIDARFTYGLTNLYKHGDWTSPRFAINIGYWFNYK